MNGVDEATRRLIDEILLSDVYKEYDEQRKMINKYPELKAQIDEYRSLNFEMQRSGGNLLEKMDIFEREHGYLREDPRVMSFLKAELAFCRMVQGINSRIVEATHFE